MPYERALFRLSEKQKISEIEPSEQKLRGLKLAVDSSIHAFN